MRNDPYGSIPKSSLRNDGQCSLTALSPKQGKQSKEKKGRVVTNHDLTRSPLSAISLGQHTIFQNQEAQRAACRGLGFCARGIHETGAWAVAGGIEHCLLGLRAGG